MNRIVGLFLPRLHFTLESFTGKLNGVITYVAYFYSMQLFEEETNKAYSLGGTFCRAPIAIVLQWYN